MDRLPSCLVQCESRSMNSIAVDLMSWRRSVPRTSNSIVFFQLNSEQVSPLRAGHFRRKLPKSQSSKLGTSNKPALSSTPEEPLGCLRDPIGNSAPEKPYHGYATDDAAPSKACRRRNEETVGRETCPLSGTAPFNTAGEDRKLMWTSDETMLSGAMLY
jgi:hypothetical protein